MDIAEPERRVLASPLQVPLPRRRPAVFRYLCLFTLRDFLRSAWVLVDLAIVAAFHFFLFTYPPGQSHFFGVEYALAMILAGVTSGALFSRASRPETYAILARPVPRASFTGALLLCSWLVAIVGHLLSTVIVVIRYGPRFSPDSPLPAWFTLGTYLRGSLPVLLIAALAVSLIALLTSFVAPAGVRLAVLTALGLLIMAFDSQDFPVPAIRPYIGELPAILAPLAGALQFATQQSPDPVATGALVALAIYAVVVTALVLWLTSTREVVL